jgi:hypothetical protein
MKETVNNQIFSGFGGDCKEDSAEERSGQCGQSQSQREANATSQEHNSSLKSAIIATSHKHHNLNEKLMQHPKSTTAL